MSPSRKAVILVFVLALGLCACGPAKDTSGAAASGSAASKAPPPPPGPVLYVAHSLMADMLHVTEKISLWREGMKRTYYRSFDDYFGMDDTDKKLIRKFAFARSELEERFAKSKPLPTFEAPFGPEGKMPPAAWSLADRLWKATMAAKQPAEISRALKGIMSPADAENLSKLLLKLAPRIGELLTERAGFNKEILVVKEMLDKPEISTLLQSFGKFAGISTRGMKFDINPVWAPEKAEFEAIAYGDRILVSMPEEKPVGATHTAMVIRAIGQRLLARMSAEKKALGTIRFVEKAGLRDQHLALVDGILDALSHGIAGPLVVNGPGEVPPWPGDDRRQKFAEALTPLLKSYLAKGRPFDGAFAKKAADIHFKVNPPKPSDYLAGAIVIGEDKTIAPFKSQVYRWTVWKFPPSKKYNYPRKFGNDPGRSALLLFTPTELKNLPKRFSGMDKLLKAMKQAGGYMQRNQPVLITVPRESRGYLFVIAAPTPEGMKKIAKAFFALKQMPQKPVVIFD
ncbi:MAG: hypothetical protein JRJ87_19115 [Deltaproteobacteria bacterium]|nr:hypothetical protein [Deltaproteobacteria bacterium]